nr:MAG TPA: Protein of unknown function (DUF3102) [Caudoviricetes sp.]
MEELIEYNNYGQFKAALDKELLSAADHFVKIGYLLKQARDTTILYESGYPNLYEFAKAEYGIDKGTVSRYIAINDRFSVGGNYPALEQRYSNRGVAKLQEMLTMSDEVIEVIPAETTKAELQDIKKDIKAEENITDMEVMLEDIPSTPVKMDCWYQQAIYYHLQNNPEIFTRIYAAMQNDPVGDKDVVLALAPNGVATPRARVPKVGTVLMSIQGTELPMAFVNVRTNEHETVPWAWIANTIKCWDEWLGTPEAVYQRIYGMAMFEQKAEPKEHTDTAEQIAEDHEEMDNIVDNNVDKHTEEKQETDQSANSAEEEIEQEACEDEIEQIIDQTEESEKVAPVQHEEEDSIGQQLAREWVSAKVKEVPDKDGEYLICRLGYTNEPEYGIDTVKTDPYSKQRRWVLWKDKVLFWMSLPPLPEVRKGEETDEQ